MKRNNLAGIGIISLILVATIILISPIQKAEALPITSEFDWIPTTELKDRLLAEASPTVDKNGYVTLSNGLIIKTMKMVKLNGKIELQADLSGNDLKLLRNLLTLYSLEEATLKSDVLTIKYPEDIDANTVKDMIAIDMIEKWNMARSISYAGVTAAAVTPITNNSRLI